MTRDPRTEDHTAQEEPEELGCDHCAKAAGLAFDFSFAFQPIVDIEQRRIFSYEALVRGKNGESAGEILGRVHHDNRYRFDQACRVKAIQLAAELGLDTYVNINFMPNAVYQASLCIRTTLAAAQKYGFPTDRIMFEVMEGERIEDHGHLRGILQEYKRLGFKTALDDFGSGHSQLNLLADYQPDYIKLDIQLVRSVDQAAVRQAIVEGIVHVCKRLDITLIAEGVETYEEWRWMYGAGIRLFQGYYFAKPGFECLPTVPDELYDNIPETAGAEAAEDEAAEAEPLTQLIYVSAASEPYSREGLVALLEQARDNNASLGVTGLLLYKDASFLQVLEGPAENVEHIYDKISKDNRHKRVSLVSKRSVENRSFKDWQMAFDRVTDHDLQQLAGYVPYDKVRTTFNDLAQETRLIERIVDGFKAGQWRQRLE